MTKTVKVHLDTLINQFRNAGFNPGLHVEKDGMKRVIYFDAIPDRTYYDFPINEQADDAKREADQIWQDHIAIFEENFAQSPEQG